VKVESIDDVVATRKYTFQAASSESEIEFKIGKPFLSPEVQDGLEYICPLCITIDGVHDFSWVVGIDSVQALLLGFSYIKARLQRLSSDNGDSLMWLTEEPGTIDIGIADLNKQ
jgi:hypothetical protein